MTKKNRNSRCLIKNNKYIYERKEVSASALNWLINIYWMCHLNMCIDCLFDVLLSISFVIIIWFLIVICFPFSWYCLMCYIKIYNHFLFVCDIATLISHRNWQTHFLFCLKVRSQRALLAEKWPKVGFFRKFSLNSKTLPIIYF